MKWSQVLLVLVAFLILATGTAAAAAPQPYVIVVDVSANHVCDGSDGWVPLGGSRVTVIREDGSRLQIFPNPTAKFLAIGEVVLEIEYPATVLPCNRTRVFVSPPAGAVGPIIPPPVPPVPLTFEVAPPPPVGALSLPTVTVEFRAVELQREN